MDTDKLKSWLDAAQKFQGGNFWSDIFDQFPQGPANPNSFQTRGHYEEEKPAPLLPLIDILERANEWIVLIDLPGVEKKDVQLLIAGNQLKIKGIVRNDFRETRFIHSERLSGSFERTIELPESIHDNQSAAAFHNGILEVRIPRSTPPEQQIQID